jgi:hypothetical protein
LGVIDAKQQFGIAPADRLQMRIQLENGIVGLQGLLRFAPRNKKICQISGRLQVQFDIDCLGVFGLFRHGLPLSRRGWGRIIDFRLSLYDRTLSRLKTVENSAVERDSSSCAGLNSGTSSWP